MTLAAVAVSGLAVAAGRASRPVPLRATVAPLLVANALQREGAGVSPLLFGLGVDLPAATYVRPGDTRCLALYGAGADVLLSTYPCTHAVHPNMLRDVNRWVIRNVEHDACWDAEDDDFEE